MQLPLRQFRVLLYLAGRPEASARDVAADLRMNRTDAQNTLRALANRSLAASDTAPYPTSFTITGEGRAALDEIAREG